VSADKIDAVRFSHLKIYRWIAVCGLLKYFFILEVYMMGEESFTRYRLLRELAELHYRIGKLEKMVKERNRKNLMSINKEECIDRDVSCLFFLGR
jgi:hypothetical protein